MNKEKNTTKSFVSIGGAFILSVIIVISLQYQIDKKVTNQKNKEITLDRYKYIQGMKALLIDSKLYSNKARNVLDKSLLDRKITNIEFENIDTEISLCYAKYIKNKNKQDVKKKDIVINDLMSD